VLLVLGCCGHVAAQTETPLVGPARNLARDAIIAPTGFDPLLVWPLAADAQAFVDLHGADDIAVGGRAAVRNGDDSYGIIAAAPLRTPDGRSGIDVDGLRTHSSLGVDLTNVIWRPRARPELQRLLPAVSGADLSPDQRAAIARALATTDALAVPWVVYLRADYRFNRGEYRYLDAATLTPRSETRLNDTASLVGGVQLLVRPGDPGYLVGFGYMYSAVFRPNDATGIGIVGGPSKVRANLLRLEIRRPLPRRG
jgi:hypothetical protein